MPGKPGRLRAAAGYSRHGKAALPAPQHTLQPAQEKYPEVHQGGQKDLLCQKMAGDVDHQCHEAMAAVGECRLAGTGITVPCISFGKRRSVAALVGGSIVFGIWVIRSFNYLRFLLC